MTVNASVWTSFATQNLQSIGLVRFVSYACSGGCDGLKGV